MENEEKRKIKNKKNEIKEIKYEVEWIEEIREEEYRESEEGLKIFIGGDKIMEEGKVKGIERREDEKGRKKLVIWIDENKDLNKMEKKKRGNINGKKVDYYKGKKGFEGYLKKIEEKIDKNNV